MKVTIPFDIQGDLLYNHVTPDLHLWEVISIPFWGMRVVHTTPQGKRFVDWPLWAPYGVGFKFAEYSFSDDSRIHWGQGRRSTPNVNQVVPREIKAYCMSKFDAPMRQSHYVVLG